MLPVLFYFQCYFIKKGMYYNQTDIKTVLKLVFFELFVRVEAWSRV